MKRHEEEAMRRATEYAYGKNGQGAGADNRLLSGRVDLGPAIRDGVEPPEELVKDVLLAGRVHSIYSGGGTGKTFAMLYLAAQVVKQGKPVVIFDMENGRRIISERLTLLGVTSEEATEFIYYFPFPTMPMEQDAIDEFEAILEEINPALVVFDSWVNCLASCGLDENSSTDVAAWADAYSQKARMRSIAVLILDHIPKEGNTARGSGRKLDYVDVQHELRNPLPFNRSAVGRIDLRLRKDREGWLPDTVSYTVGGKDGGFIFGRRTTESVTGEEAALTAREETVLAALRHFGSIGAFDHEWKEEAAVRGVRSESTYYAARKKLIEQTELAEKVMEKYFAKVLQK